MFKNLMLFGALVAFLPGTAIAQQTPPAWDVAVSAGSFHGRPGDADDSAYHDGWYHNSEWRATVGRYWTSHLKTEIEFAATSEGDRFVQRFTTVPGSATLYPYSAQDFFRARQGSVRMAWQFLDNQWIHPYVFAGVSLEEERKRTHVHPQFYSTGDPRNPDSRAVGVREEHEGPVTNYRPGLVMGGGAKWYVSSSVFVKTVAQATVSKPSRSVSFLFGMGFDF